MVPSDNPEVPEADALEQAQEVVPTEDFDENFSDDPEVPEADALDQHRTVVRDEDYEA